eukprot:scaffold482_cov247-Pinguiococcus_pyrenoidosus.AAC.15
MAGNPTPPTAMIAPANTRQMPKMSLGGKDQLTRGDALRPQSATRASACSQRPVEASPSAAAFGQRPGGMETAPGWCTPSWVPRGSRGSATTSVTSLSGAFCARISAARGATPCVHCADFWDFLFAALGTYFIGTQLVVPAVGSAAFAAFYFGAGGAANLFAAFYANSHPRLSKPPGFRVYLNKYSEVSGTQGSLGALLGFAAVAAPTASVYIYGVVPVPLGLAAALFLGFPIYQAYQHGVRDAAVVAQLAGAMLGAGRFLALRS